MTAELSIHDNVVYAQSIDYSRRVAVLHTVYMDELPPEYTDVVFSGIQMYYIEQVLFDNGNILFGVEEINLSKEVLIDAIDNVDEMKKWSWPLPDWKDTDDLVAKLTSSGAKFYEISSSYGMCGYIVAERMELRKCDARAHPVKEAITAEKKARTIELTEFEDAGRKFVLTRPLRLEMYKIDGGLLCVQGLPEDDTHYLLGQGDNFSQAVADLYSRFVYLWDAIACTSDPLDDEALHLRDVLQKLVQSVTPLEKKADAPTTN